MDTRRVVNRTHVLDAPPGHDDGPGADTRACPRLERQLVARLQDLLGASPRRRTIGSYRWTTPPARRASKAAVPLPRRVVEKPVS